MQSIGDILNNIEFDEDISHLDVLEDEYIGEDGLIYCNKCKTPRICKGITRMVRCLCKCRAEERDRAQELEKQKQKIKRIEKIKSASLLGEKYKDVSFNNTRTDHNASFSKIYGRCRKYCDVADKVLKSGIGIYLFGDKGTGKSRLTACMANELMSKYYSVLYTNFSEISKYIRNSFGSKLDSEYDFIERLTNIDFLFIDDFGTELVSKNDQDLWLQEKVFEVINKRYNNNKPIIFTSNYSLRQLLEERGVADKTIDRIAEMCEVIKIEGVSYRATAKREREVLF